VQTFGQKKKRYTNRKRPMSYVYRHFKNKLSARRKELKFTKENAKIMFHTTGFSCLGGAIFLQILVFSDILINGYFMAIERNLIIFNFRGHIDGLCVHLLHPHLSTILKIYSLVSRKEVTIWKTKRKNQNAG